ncbi:DNA polymerase III, alpha subunit [Aeromicrobium marinum DSM 15272]|uniref:Error-prone DNA polymerase n=1 Tax=Aeromicrobium marinum DSM 15272 TaxID=585531 RepID=E2SCV9_9ACTN|nr:error-prone DNA polymerase [Aeromicrobium marinum]EFQ83062.1 DNA polymerase III, alpha subunit [Aeromicrobium marinum DSM 15272]
MGWNNPDMPWRELERRLSGAPLTDERPDGGDGPAFSRKRPRYEPTPLAGPSGPVVPYAELHCHSHYSFLDGASGPADLAEEAVRLGLSALALTDHDGFAGAPVFAEAAQEHGLATVFGAELSLGLPGPQNGVADPVGTHLLVLARGAEGYHRLAAAITDAHLHGDEKGRPVYDLDQLAAHGRDHWIVLTGCRKGAVRHALATAGVSAAAAELDRLTALFGLDHVVVELTHHGLPDDSRRNDALASLAADHGLPVVATGNVHHATPAGGRLAAAMAAIRARRSLADLDGWLPPSGAAHLRSGAEMQARFARYPGAVARSVTIAEQIAFDLRSVTPRLPVRGVPAGHTNLSWLRELADRGIARRYAHDPGPARERIERELAVIADKGFEGYFLIVHDIVREARERGILCQGRGSSANSALCYALEITAVDSIRYGLPFERFLASTRDEEPDIDVDFDSDRREEVIQWVYDTYGRRNAAQVANVITYRPRSAIRDAAKALGYSTGQQDAWSRSAERWGGLEPDAELPAPVVELAEQLMGSPRHLGIHSGGMILTERPIGEVCPIERARMTDRTVLQWDKDACEWMGLVKFDLLGLGMLGALDHTFGLVETHLGERWGLDTIPKEEPGVFDMLCRADSIGVFQVESRAQIGTLPRLQPRSYYDLAIEIALIRPGPIQGGAVHPYIRRATGREPVTYPHPVLEPVLRRTKGVPLFQEQLMQMAIVLGGCTGDEADLLRRAMGSKRGIERIERLKDQLFTGMAEHGITGEAADAIYVTIQSFANFGFAESHALSFALLVYASSWLKLHYPAAFLAALLRNQPMGFYSPQSLVADARHHGVTTRGPDIVRSMATADLEPLDARSVRASGLDSCLHREQPPMTRFDPDGVDPTTTHRRDEGLAVRLGLDAVQGVGAEVAARVVAAREERPFADMADVARRTALTVAQMESLATAGAFDSFGLTRRQALWNAGYTDRPDQLPGTATTAPPPTLPGMSAVETTLADLWSTRISPDRHPMEHLRELLTSEQVLSVAGAMAGEHGRRVRVAGLITHRQRPMTASGVTFLNLEDETGMLNVVVLTEVWERNRRVLRNAAGVVIRGMLEITDARVVNLVAERADRIEGLYPAAAGRIPGRHRSRDYQ